MIFLIIFYSTTLVVSISSKSKSYKCYGEIMTNERNLTGLASILDSDLKLKASEMLKKFLKYYDGIKCINKMLILVVPFFDLRKKMHFKKLCFENLYGKDNFEAKEMLELVSDLLTCIFNEYNMRFRGFSKQASGSTQASNVSGLQSQEQAVEIMKLVIEDFGYERMDVVYKVLVAKKVKIPRMNLKFT